MDLNYAERLGVVIATIEHKLATPLTLDALAKSSGLSPSHLLRLFHSLAGHSVMDYVRKRRLTRSLELLSNTGLRILDIALETGFGFEQSYIRAFSKNFGLSPGEYRKQRPILKTTPALIPDGFEALGDQAVLLNPRQVFLPGLTLFGVRHQVDLAENAQKSKVSQLAFKFWLGMAWRAPAPRYAGQYWGLIEYSGDPAWNWYSTCVRLKPRPAPLRSVHGTRIFETVGQAFAAFTLIAPCRPQHLKWGDVAAMYDRIAGHWLPGFGAAEQTPWHLEFVEFTKSRQDYGEFTLLYPLPTRASPH